MKYESGKPFVVDFQKNSKHYGAVSEFQPATLARSRMTFVKNSHHFIILFGDAALTHLH